MHIALQSPSPWLQRCRQSGLSWRCALQSAPSDTPSWSLPWWCAASMYASGTRSSECVCRCLDPQSASSGSPCNAGSPAPSDRFFFQTLVKYKVVLYYSIGFVRCSFNIVLICTVLVYYSIGLYGTSLL